MIAVHYTATRRCRGCAVTSVVDHDGRHGKTGWTRFGIAGIAEESSGRVHQSGTRETETVAEVPQDTACPLAI